MFKSLIVLALAATCVSATAFKGQRNFEQVEHIQAAPAKGVRQTILPAQESYVQAPAQQYDAPSKGLAQESYIQQAAPAVQSTYQQSYVQAPAVQSYVQAPAVQSYVQAPAQPIESFSSKGGFRSQQVQLPAVQHQELHYEAPSKGFRQAEMIQQAAPAMRQQVLQSAPLQQESLRYESAPSMGLSQETWSAAPVKGMRQTILPAQETYVQAPAVQTYQAPAVQTYQAPAQLETISAKGGFRAQESYSTAQKQ